MKRLFLIVATLFFVAAQANAATVAWHTEKEMVRKASAIVRGTVLQASPRWEGGLIVTDIKIQVARVFKGKGLSGRNVVTMVQLGGTLDGKTLKVSGNSSYQVGEEVVLFMEPSGSDLVEMGIGAGKFVVDRHGPQPMIKRELGGVAFVRVTGKVAKPIARPEIAAPENLSSFETRILGYLNR